MHHTIKQKIAHIGRIILAWLLAYSVFAFIRVFGIGDLPFVEVARVVVLEEVVFQLFIASAITGVLYGGVDLFLDNPNIQRQAYWRILVLKTLLNLVIVIIVATLLSIQRVRWGLLEDPGSEAPLLKFLLSKTFIVFVIYFGIVDLVLSIYQQINQKFGRGVLLEMMLGRYHKPVEDQRIFMFIDLKSSVTIAEQLGHIQYSYLLQDCFFDLNTLLSKYKARIYQYVGDEVVLYWNLKDGLNNNNCIQFFLGFMDRLEKRAPHYASRFGLQPFFKAGVHMGRVTIAEIGLLKRDIAFHGDTVNTTSRIQGKCNAFSQRILLSKELLNHLEEDPDLQFIYVGNEILKGKHSGMELYGISMDDHIVKTKTPEAVPA